MYASLIKISNFIFSCNLNKYDDILYLERFNVFLNILFLTCFVIIIFVHRQIGDFYANLYFQKNN